MEERGRKKVIPHLSAEKSVLKLGFSVLVRSSMRWQRIPINALELESHRIVEERIGDHKRNDAEEKGSAARLTGRLRLSVITKRI